MSVTEIEINCAHDKLVPIEELVPNPRNPNTHSPEQVAWIAKVIRPRGWRAPVVVSTRSGFIVCGHGRLAAANQAAADQAAAQQAAADKAAADNAAASATAFAASFTANAASAASFAASFAALSASVFHRSAITLSALLLATN